MQRPLSLSTHSVWGMTYIWTWEVESGAMCQCPGEKNQCTVVLFVIETISSAPVTKEK